MIELTGLIALGMVIAGMWGAFYLGSRKEQGEIFASEKNLTPEELDIPEEPTEEEYQKSLKTWDLYGEDTESSAG